MQNIPPPLSSPDYLDSERQWAYWSAALSAALRDVRAQDKEQDVRPALLPPEMRQEIHESLFPHFGNEASLLAIDFALNAVANVKSPPKEKIKFGVTLTDVASAVMRYSAQTLHSYVQSHGFVDGLLGASMSLHAQMGVLSRDFVELCMNWSQAAAQSVACAQALACSEAAAIASESGQDASFKLFRTRLNNVDAASIMGIADEVTANLQNHSELALALIDLTEPNISWIDTAIRDATGTDDVSLKIFFGDVSRRILGKGGK